MFDDDDDDASINTSNSTYSSSTSSTTRFIDDDVDAFYQRCHNLLGYWEGRRTYNFSVKKKNVQKK